MTYTLAEERRRRLVLLLFISFTALGVLIRVWRFGSVPGGINQDEAFAGYEAWSLLNYGMDSSGHSFPVYLSAWGSGMNALESYLMLPFMAVFGPEVWVVRLPQLIVACLSLPAVFGSVRRLCGARAGLTALLLVAVCPWHIYLSRWGLESNLAPGFLTFGLYFFIRGLENERFLPVCALMFGLSLYTYAVLWPVLPVMLLLMLGCGFRCCKLRFSWWFAASAAVLLALAAPLVLFLLVNLGVMEEFTIGPFSVPRLVVMRSSEISLKNIGANAANLWQLFVEMTGQAPFTYTGNRGLFSICTLPFFLLGFLICLKRTAGSIRRRELGLEALLVVQLFSALLLGLLTSVNETRFNCAYIPMLMTTALGLDWLVRLSKKELAAGVMFAAYLVHFGAFACYYFGEYSERMSYSYSVGLEEALECASEAKDSVCLATDIYYSDVLFYTRQPTDEYVETVVYSNYPSAFLDVESFGRYSFGFDAAEADPDCAYIFHTGGLEAEALLDSGFALQTFGVFTVALKA